MYWALLYPIHVLIFRGMLRALARIRRQISVTGRGFSGKLRNGRVAAVDLGTHLHERALAQGLGSHFELLKVFESEVWSGRCQVEAFVADLDYA